MIQIVLQFCFNASLADLDKLMVKVMACSSNLVFHSILLFSVLKLKSLSVSMNTESMQCSSTTATPCMISGGSPDVT